MYFQLISWAFMIFYFLNENVWIFILQTLPEPIVEEKINANEKLDTVNDER